MKILNKRSFRTELCGTPCKSSAQELKLSQIFILCHLLERWFKISCRDSLLKPYAEGFEIKSS